MTKVATSKKRVKANGKDADDDVPHYNLVLHCLLWNQLPEATKKASSLSCFKTQVKQFMFNE